MRMMICVFTMTAASAALAAPLIYEPFAYPSGLLAGQTNASTGNQWFLAGASSNGINVVSGNLTPPGNLEPATGSMLAITGSSGNSGGTNRLALPNAVTSGNTVYFSFILRVDSLTGSNNVLGGFFTGLNNTVGAQAGNPGTVGARVQCRIDPIDGAKYNLGIFNNRTQGAADPSWSTALEVGQTLFVVASYELVAGPGNDVSRLWIAPDPGTFAQVDAPAATLTDTTPPANPVNDLSETAVRTVIVRQSNTPFLTMDELRVGLSWADVTPLGVPCHDPVFDADGDGDVDLGDFAAFQICHGLPATTSSCRCFDQDESGTIDGFDFEGFKACAPPGGLYRDAVQADPACDG